VPENRILQSSLVLVGPGRAGMALARSWVRAGGRLSGIVSRTRESASSAATELRTSPQSLDTVDPACDLLVLAVPDDRIASVASELATRTTCRFAFHLSGALPAAILAPLSREGTSLGSLHPLRAFTGDPRETWQDALVAIEGEPDAAEAGERVTAALGGLGHRIRSESKPLYHAAATLAAGGSMALLSIAVRAAADAGLPEAEARPALARLASEALAAAALRPLRETFTGPVARRDARTVRAHRVALADRPDFWDLYRRLARETLLATAGRGGEEEIGSILDEQQPTRRP
jgi:predicted short-subunit dehydrogenase-like oxidoreductase (DUF2520 family)